MVLHLSKTEEAKLAELEPETQSRVRQLLARLEARGFRYYVGSAVRDLIDQAAALADGKSDVKVGWHQLARAVDIYSYDPVAHEIDLNGRNEDFYRALHEEAYELGLWGLAYRPYPSGPKHFLSSGAWDGGHVEFHGPYATLAEAISAEGEKYGVA